MVSSPLISLLILNFIGVFCHASVNSCNEQCPVGVEFKTCSDIIFGSECNGETDLCQCSPANDFIEECSLRKCLPLAKKVGDPCEIHEQCLVLGETAVCFVSSGNGACYCPEGPGLPSYVNIDGKCLKYATLIGNECIEDKQCSVLGDTDVISCTLDPENPDDVGNVCRCIDDVAVQVENTCLPYIDDWTSICQDSAQCMTNTECKLNNATQEMQCQCRNGFVQYGTGCLMIVDEIGANCLETIQCTAGMGKNAICNEDSRCQCIEGHQFHPPTKQCFKPVAMNETCTDDGDCYVGIDDNTKCQPIGNATGKCTCLSYAIPWEGNCFLPKKVGDYCEKNEECSVPILGPAVCNPREKMCVCNVGYKPDIEGVVCSLGPLVRPFFMANTLLLSVVLFVKIYLI